MMEFTLRSNREKRHVILSFTLEPQSGKLCIPWLKEEPWDETNVLPKNVSGKMNDAWFKAQPLMYGNWNGIF